MVLESDAIDPSLLAVPLSAIQTIVNQAPEDYDLIFLTRREVEAGAYTRSLLSST